ncbi:MAG: Gfo/Idh/MocA family oxidoreductase [Pirellulales bacterium]|nr:Gfo/Idh/MocA family oxidoreductase [Pirellulales bacterium]
MPQEKLGVAIHGAGWVAHAHARSWLKNPHAQIVLVSDVDPDRARRLLEDVGADCAVRDRYEDVLTDPAVDVVDICSPSHLHAEHGIAAARAGKHLQVEKPVALTLEDNRALRDAVAKAGVKSQASFVLRWNPMIETLKSLLTAGAIGKLFYVEVDYWHAIKPTHHAWNLHSRRATAGSTMLLAGCHAVDAARWLAGDEVVEVTAYANNVKGNFEYEANVVALFKFAGGIIGKVSALFDCEMPYAFNVDLAGTEGTLRDNRVWSKPLFPRQNDWAVVPAVLPTSSDVNHHPFDGEINHLVDCILQNRESHCNLADAYRSHELCLAIDRSIAAGGRPIRLPLGSE